MKHLQNMQITFSASMLSQSYFKHFISILIMACSLTCLPVQATTNAKGIAISFITHPNANHNVYPDYNLSLDKVLIDATIAPASKAVFNQDPFNNNLWLRIKAGYDMPTIDSPYTHKYEAYYADRPDYVEQMMLRSSKYLYYVISEVEKRGMPTEIALLPMIESAYNPKAYSRSHAAGIWQFVPATGKHFGLQQNWWKDNRRDVIAATQAALDYLEKLHGMFGSWDLALAAYNAGEGTVGRAIAANKRKGLPTDYQSLKLPLETKQYVPKLQAIKNIVNTPINFGLNIAPIPNEVYFTEIDAPEQIDAKLAAELAEIPLEEFQLLNPSYKRPIIASKRNIHKILLPISAVDRFQDNLNNYDASLISWTVYRAKRGERLSNIAKKFNIRTSSLRKVNSLPHAIKLAQPLHLLVPSSSEKYDKINVAILANQKTAFQQLQRRNIKHKIRRGETLSTIAKRYGTNTKSIMRLNHLKSTRIKIGQVIKVKGGQVRHRVATHKIRRGDTLSAIAKRYGTNTKRLMKMNRLRSTQLKIGQVLKVRG